MKPAIKIFYKVSLCLMMGFIGRSNAIGQESEPGRFTGFVEFGGPAGPGSINVERRLTSKDKWALKGRLGFFILPHSHLTKVPNSYFYPLSFNFLAGGSDHRLELNAGSLITANNDGYLEDTDDDAYLGIYGHGFIGYRWLPNDNWFLRIGYTPLYHPNIDAESVPVASMVTGKWLHWGSMGFGMRF